MRQRFSEDRVELEAHFADRVQSYIELGETPEQARISAAEKFGETESVVRELERRKLMQSPIVRAAIWAVGYMLLLFVFKAAWERTMLTSIYAMYVVAERPMRKTCTARRNS